MLSILIRLRIQEILNQMQGGKNKKNVAGLVFLYIMAFAAVAFLFSMIFQSICMPYHFLGLDWLYFAFCGMICFTLCFIGSVFLTQKQIYEANDNETLLSMPIKPMHILLSRIISLLGLNYIYAIAISLPAMGIYIYNIGFNIKIFLIYILLFLFLPLLSLALSMIFGCFIAWISSKVAKPKIITIFISMIFMLAYFYLCFAWQGLVQDMAQSGEAVADVFKTYLTVFYLYGMGIVKVDILFLILFILISTIPFAIICFLISRSFISIATSSKGGKKIVYRAKKVKVRSVKAALIHKECAMLLGSPTYILNAGMGVLFMPLLGMYLLLSGGKINSLAQFVGMDFIGLFLCFGLALTTVMVTITSPSFSLESKTLWILKSLPIKERDIIVAKLMPHIIFSLPFILVGGVLIEFASDIRSADRVMLFLMPIVATIMNAMIGLFLGMCFPKFNWTNEAVAIKQSSAPLLSMLCGLAVNGGVFGLIIIFIKAEMFKINQLSIVAFAIYLILCMIFAIIIRSKGAELIKKMQN